MICYNGCDQNDWRCIKTERIELIRLVIAELVPLAATLFSLIYALIDDVTIATKIVYALVWIPAIFCMYFSLKHAIIPDLDFGFIKAIKPYNVFVLLLCFSELLCLTAWDYYYPVPMAIGATVFGALCICTMLFAKKGVKKWTI